MKRPYRLATLLRCVILLVGVFWWNVAAMLVTQQQVFSYLDATFSELKSLRSENVDDKAWQQFRQSSLTKLTAFVPKLEKDADVSDPASLSLLAVSCDYLPKLLNEESRFSDELEYNITWHLDVARLAISQDAGRAKGISPEFWMLLLVSLNAGLLLYVVLFVAKKLTIKSAG